MRILVLAHSFRTGGGRVTCTNLLRALRDVDEDNEYLFVVPDQPEYRGVMLENERCDVAYYRRRFGHPGRLWFDWHTVRKILRSYRPDVLWSMGNTGLVNPPCPQAISLQNAYQLYDLQNLGSLRVTERVGLYLLQRSLRKSLFYTDVVFCQTATMKERLKGVLDYRGRTIVTYKSVSDVRSASRKELPTRLTSYAERYKLLYVTHYYPHKGLEMLVDVMDRYRDELSDTIVVTTMASEQHRCAARLLERIRKVGLEDRIVNVGPIAHEDLEDYYRACDCLLMPTRLESFSGSYLEAMHFGLPILTSDLDFAHEICGNAALYFNPWDARSIKDAILQLKGNSELSAELVVNGKRRLNSCFGHTWNDIAKIVQVNLEAIGYEGRARRGRARRRARSSRMDAAVSER